MLRKLLLGGLVLLLTACAGNGVPRQDMSNQAPEAGDPASMADPRTRAAMHTELGVGYLMRGQMQVALDELGVAVQSDPGYGPAHNALGLTYMQLGEDDKAQRYFEQAVRINPNDSDAHNNYGWFLCQQNRLDAAMEHFRQAVKNPLYQNPEKAYANMGICAARKGDMVAATDYLERALELRREFPLALLNLADVAYREKRYTDARAYMARLQLQGPLNAEGLWLAYRIERKRMDRAAMDGYAMQLRNRFPRAAETEKLRNGQFE